jgi:tetratricopeptide (TPR) repeat protein
MAKKKDITEERIEAVEEALSKSEQFIERNQKILTYVIGGIILIVLLFFGYKKFIQMPQEKTAQRLMFKAEYYFEQDSVDLALYGDGENFGFIDVIDKYGSTSAGNLAKYYSGICFYTKGDYLEAIKYLKRFKSSDLLVSAMSFGAIGDAYMQLGNSDKALDYYLKAARYDNNEVVSPTFYLKAGWSYEINNEWKKALEVYQQIKKEYPKSREARDIDKYIARTEAKLGVH